MLHGIGKTLIARQIGKMLNGREPKIVNGPEVLNKYVGQSEENVRKLFADAEAEQVAKGENSELHVIIFDEIDAICKSRGSVKYATLPRQTCMSAPAPARNVLGAALCSSACPYHTLQKSGLLSKTMHATWTTEEAAF